jgi:hypothetical protein
MDDVLKKVLKILVSLVLVLSILFVFANNNANNTGDESNTIAPSALVFNQFPGKIPCLEVALVSKGLSASYNNEVTEFDVYVKNVGNQAVSFTDANGSFNMAIGGWNENQTTEGRSSLWPNIDGITIAPGKVFRTHAYLSGSETPNDGIVHLMLLLESPIVIGRTNERMLNMFSFRP